MNMTSEPRYSKNNNNNNNKEGHLTYLQSLLARRQILVVQANDRVGAAVHVLVQHCQHVVVEARVVLKQ